MSLTLGWFLGRAADLTNIKRGRYRDDAGVDFPINAEHPDQRAALLAAFTGLGTEAALQAILAKLIAGPATDAKVEAVRALLAGTLAVSATALPLPSGAATSAAQEAMRALLAGTLAVSAASLPLPTGAATGAKQDTGNTALAAIVTALAGTLNVLPLIKPWATWAPATAIDMRNYAGVEIQVTGAGTATFTRSADDATYAAISATASGVAAASPLAVGFYSLKGGGFLKFAGTATILIRGYN